MTAISFVYQEWTSASKSETSEQAPNISIYPAMTHALDGLCYSNHDPHSGWSSGNSMHRRVTYAIAQRILKRNTLGAAGVLDSM